MATNVSHEIDFEEFYFRGSHEIIFQVLQELGGSATERVLYDYCGVIGFSEEEVAEILEELSEEGELYRSAGVWKTKEISNNPNLDIASKVGYRIRRKKDGKIFVITLSGDLSNIDSEDSEHYIAKETWVKSYLYGMYEIVCFACLEEVAGTAIKMDIPICTSCAMHLSNHFGVDGDEVFVRELIYALRQAEDQISKQDINYVTNTWSITNGYNNRGYRRLWINTDREDSPV